MSPSPSEVSRHTHSQHALSLRTVLCVMHLAVRTSKHISKVPKNSLFKVESQLVSL